jgi:predicted MFS family arabinose efflux permease
LYRWKPSQRELPYPASTISGAIQAGVRYARQERRVKAVLMRTLMFSLFASSFWALLPLVARGYGAVGYGAMLAYFGLGALAGAAVLAKLRQKMTLDAVVAAATVVFALAVFGLVRTQTLAMASLCAGAAGLAWICALATLNFVAQTAAPGWVRARVISMYVLALQGGLALGSAVWGVVAARAGLRQAMTVAAAALICGLLLGPWYRLQTSGDH